MHPEYEAGRAARREGVKQDDNPHRNNPANVEFVSKAGRTILKLEAQEAALAWACGWRDENDVLWQKKNGRIKELRDFVSPQRRARYR